MNVKYITICLYWDKTGYKYRNEFKHPKIAILKKLLKKYYFRRNKVFTTDILPDLIF